LPVVLAAELGAQVRGPGQGRLRSRRDHGGRPR